MSNNPEPIEQRVIELESVIAHLQHDLEQMNEVLLQQQSELQTLRLALGRVEDRIGQLNEDAEVRDPRDERPPHY